MQLDARAPARSAGSFGLYDEGGGTLSLYLDATDPQALLRDLLECAREGQVAYLMDGPVPPGGRPLSSGGWLGEAEGLLELRGPAEIVLLGPEVSPEEVEAAMPCSLLAYPEHALPNALDARLALILTEDGHAIVLSREKDLLCPCLSRFVERAVRQALPHLLQPPEIPNRAILDLLEPMTQSAWCELGIHELRRYRLLTWETRDSEDGRTLDRRQWVAPSDGGSWHAGWSW